MAKYTAIGGQALIEGILMKSPEKTAMAVRKKDGSIDLSYMNDRPLKEKYKIFGIPVIRGIIAYIESMTQGYKALMKSADISGFTDLDEEEEKKEKTKKDEKKENALIAAIMVIGSVLGVLLSLVLFIGIPRLAVGGLQTLFGNFSPVVRASIEQLIKLAILVGYMWIISFMKDMRRVFMYHGAEHKTIFCYEKGLPLTVENVRTQRRFHPRCGTSFLVLMILISLIFSTVVQLIFPSLYGMGILWVAVKILLIIPICGVGYEVLRVCGKYDNVLTKIISAPGMWLQRITTKEPDDSMIEIAIAALRACEPENPDVDRSVDKQTTDQGEEI